MVFDPLQPTALPTELSSDMRVNKQNSSIILQIVFVFIVFVDK